MKSIFFMIQTSPTAAGQQKNIEERQKRKKKTEY
jgi:hypothetical protein